MFFRFASVCLALIPLISVAELTDTSCYYVGKQDGGRGVYSESCGRVSDAGELILFSEHHENLLFRKNGLACVNLSVNTAFLVHEDGRSMSVRAFENGCDDFIGGFARGKLEDREVYIDEDLNVVLDPGFERLGPFRYEFGTVCEGPIRIEPDETGALRYVGKCGLIDGDGNIVIEPKERFEDDEVFRDYRNSHNECPAPPIQDEESAICHAKRHARNTYRPDEWVGFSVVLHDEMWVVRYRESASDNWDTVLMVGAAKANLLGSRTIRSTVTSTDR